MVINFKRIKVSPNALKPYVIEEVNNLTRKNDESIESEISEYSPEQRYNFCKYIFEKYKQLVILDVKDSQVNDEIERCIKMFFYIIDFAPKNLDIIFDFQVSAFQQNPQLVNDFLRKKKGSIPYFINRFRKPFNQNHFNYANILINTSQQVCDELIVIGLFDNIQSGIYDSMRFMQAEKDLIRYWILALHIINEIAKNCSPNMVLFEYIRDICCVFFDDFFTPDVILQSVECLITVTSLINDMSIITPISDYLPFFDQILCENHVLEEVKPIIQLICNISTKSIEVDFFKNQFVQHLIEISIEWDEYKFESVFENLYKILTFTLQYHKSLITDITQSNVLNLAVFYFNEGGCSIKNELLRFFSRLCDDCFYEYVSDFFEENSEIISSLFLMLQTDISEKSKIIIIHALTTLAINLKERSKILPNLISQYQLQSSFDAYMEVKDSENEYIVNECILLNRAVNNLIQDTQ